MNPYGVSGSKTDTFVNEIGHGQKVAQEERFAIPHDLEID